MWSLDDPRQPPPSSWLSQPGGFVWWYIDALDAQGDGLVCIWSWGLPFLPGDRAARRRGRGPSPTDRPSLNLVLYRHHRPVYYTLYRPRTAHRGEDSWRFDDCTLTRTHRDGRVEVCADIHLPVPGSPTPLTGHFRLEGVRTTLPPHASSPPVDAPHRWTPLSGPATLDVDLCQGDRALLRRAALPAYHDRNASSTALDELGMKRWTWGRHLLGDRTVVHYLSWPQDPAARSTLILATIDREGLIDVEQVERVDLLARRTGRVGMPWWRRLQIPTRHGPLEILHGPPVDDGPFYLRMPTRARLNGQAAPGWAEWCEPDRIDRWPLRWLVSMCVQHAHRPDNSLWNPLFVGTSHDAWPRLLASWRGSGVRP